MTALETRPKTETKSGKDGRTTLPKRSHRRRNILLGVLAIVVVVAAIVAVAGAKTPPKPVAAPAPPALSAHGVVEPVAQATIATINGGVVRSLAVRVGQNVGEQQMIAEVATAAQTETLVAPWAGTIMGLNVQRGDTVMPGAVVATIGDLSRYQVRTTDVDEYLIAQIQAGQPVSMTVEALDGRKLEGIVDSVALVQQTSNSGVTNYPVIIRLSDNDQDLRPGMTVRVVFSPKGP